MIRIMALLWVVLLVVAGGTVMHVSYQVRHVEKHIAELGSQTQQERDAIRILGAEWDTLNDPKRIDALSQRFLALQPTPIQRVLALESIPFKSSTDQIGSLLANSGGKKPAKPALAAKEPAVPIRTVKAEIPIPAQRPIVRVAAQPALDPVGLILARAERGE